MLVKTPTGTWLPAYVPDHTLTLMVLLLFCSMVQSATGGYDGSMLNGLNILPSYTDYFNLDPATEGLQTASVFIGGILGPLVGGMCTDYFGRRLAILYSTFITLLGIILQTAAQNVAMFTIARVFLGLGSGISGIAAAVYLNETFAARWRAWGVGTLNNFYYVGALIAAGVTVGTAQWESTWAWRCPSLIQGIFSIICIAILPFIPESPRWLIHRNLHQDAHTTIALCNANGDTHDPIVLAQYKEILDTIEFEKAAGQTLSPMQIFKTKTNRRRLLIGSSPGWISCSVGNIIASYYLGPELDTAGITDTTAQLEANVVLNAWCLACALAGTQLLSRWGRKPTALVCQILLTALMFIIGGLSLQYANNPDGASNALVYGNVSAMFLFQGAYSLCWTPILNLYPPEIMNYSMRANGFAFTQLTLNALALVLVFVMPIGIANIGWKMYMINAGWDVLYVIFIAVFWVETKGLTLEEIDAIFEGTTHSNVPNIESIIKGKTQVDASNLEKQLGRTEDKSQVATAVEVAEHK